MPLPRLRIAMSTEDLRPGLQQIRAEFEIPRGFPADVEAEARAIDADGAGSGRPERADHRHLPFVTIDPPGSKDLDQAFFAERAKGGYRVHYAIADVAPFVPPEGAIDREAWRRGLTRYLPDGKAPLHPTALSDDRASLLPDVDRPALLWTIDLDASGAVQESRLEPTVVRSLRAYSYAEVQSALDSGSAEEPLRHLREIGRILEAREVERDGVSLNLPSREVARVGSGYVFRYERVLPVEQWNAQISLLAGHCAATIMLEGGIGVLRTLPPVDRRRRATLERAAKGLGIEWPNKASLGDVVRGQDGSTPESAAFLTQATHALRGAGYTVVGEGADGAGAMEHGALRMKYAHVTAPLRRLVDRYANEIVVSLCAGKPVPDWAAKGLPNLPETMADADRRSDAVEAAVLNLAESLVLAPHVGSTFRATVIDAEEDHARIMLRDPPVVEKVKADGVELGTMVEVRLVEADPARRSITFELA
ncbi:MAG TPA: RNB domain-containing ribonuclease [Actinomycetota bacterium]|nr:RNB domain-containing ribonuclease [Actinomycetota bacterium]